MTTQFNDLITFRNCLIALTAITWAIGLLDIQYRVDKQIGFDNNFPGEIALWKKQAEHSGTAIEANGVSLKSQTQKQAIAYRSFKLPPPSERLENTVRVRGIIQTLAEADALPKNQEAGYMIWFRDSNDKSFGYNTVQRLTGYQTQYRAEKIVRIPENAQEFVLAMVNRKSNGSFKLIDAGVSLVRSTVLYKIVHPIIFTLWGSCFLIACIWLFQKRDHALSAMLGLLLCTAVVGVTLPASVTMNIIEPAYASMLSWTSINSKESLTSIYKAGHFIVFFLIALAMFIRGKHIGISAAISLQYLLILAVATEGFQLYLYNRTAHLLDIIVDLSGVLLAWVLVWGLSYLFSAHALRNQVNNDT